MDLIASRRGNHEPPASASIFTHYRCEIPPHRDFAGLYPRSFHLSIWVVWRYKALITQFGLIPAGVFPRVPNLATVHLPLPARRHLVMHILLNMLFLWILARSRVVWGANRFLRYYFLTGVGPA